MKRDSKVMVVVVQLMIEENLMEKNPDEIVTMLWCCYSKQQQQQKNTQQDLTRVEIVEKKHDEENQHQVEIELKWQDQTKGKQRMMKNQIFYLPILLKNYLT